jgi:hypothetical protein
MGRNFVPPLAPFTLTIVSANREHLHSMSKRNMGMWNLVVAKQFVLRYDAGCRRRRRRRDDRQEQSLPVVSLFAGTSRLYLLCHHVCRRTSE